jgi:hypothetical protein
MSAASERPFKYKFMDDDRPLSPPHHRFPEMHPETAFPKENDVFLETSTDADLGFVWAAMAGVFFLCWIIGSSAVKNFLDTDGLIVLGISLFCGLLSLLLPEPLPIRLHRPSQTLIWSKGKKIYRMPWSQIHARINKWYNIRAAHSIYSLDFGFGEPGQKPQFWLCVGGGEYFEEKALRDWEHFCRYMESGPVTLTAVAEPKKSKARRYYEEDSRGPFIRFIARPFFFLPVTVTGILMSIRVLKRKWPQEIIDICENHPLFKGGVPEKRIPETPAGGD